MSIITADQILESRKAEALGWCSKVLPKQNKLLVVFDDGRQLQAYMRAPGKKIVLEGYFVHGEKKTDIVDCAGSIAGLKYMLEQKSGLLYFAAPKDEVYSLVSDENLNAEAMGKDQERARLPTTIAHIAEKLIDIEQREKYRKLNDSRAQWNIIQSLSEIVASASMIIYNLSDEVRNQEATK